MPEKAVERGNSKNFGIGSLVLQKNEWIKTFCWIEDVASVIKEKIGYNFKNTVEFGKMMKKVTTQVAACYPNFRIEASDGFKKSFIQSKKYDIIPNAKLDFIIDNSYPSEKLKIKV